MATYYFRNTGNPNWSVITNWSLTNGGASAGAKPSTTSDTAVFTTLSGDCIVDSGAPNILNLDCTTYTGTLTINDSSNLSISGGSITFNSQTKIAGTAYLAFGGASITLLTNGCVIPRLTPYTTSVILMDTLNISDTLLINSGGTSWTGNFGFITNNYYHNVGGAGTNTTFKVGNTYVIKGRFSNTLNSPVTHNKYISGTPGTMATLICTGDITVGYADFTDINASQGRTIYTWGGVVSNCINVNTFTDRVAPVNSTITASVIA